MDIREVVKELDLEVFVEGKTASVNGGYVSDLLSDVMANADEGALWITLQRHMNIIAVAQLKKLPAVLITGGAQPEKDVRERSLKEGLWLLGSRECSFAAAGKLYSLLKRG